MGHQQKFAVHTYESFVRNKMFHIEPDNLNYYHASISEYEAKNRLASANLKDCYLVMDDLSKREKAYILMLKLGDQVTTIKFDKLLSYFYCEMNKFNFVDNVVNYCVHMKTKSSILGVKCFAVECTGKREFFAPMTVAVCTKPPEKECSNLPYCQLNRGDLLEIENRMNNDWCWVKHMKTKQQGIFRSKNLAAVDPLHMRPYYMDRLDHLNFKRLFLTSANGTYFVEGCSVSGYYLYVKVEQPTQYHKVKFIVSSQEVICMGNVFDSIDSMIRFYHNNPVFGSQKLVQCLPKQLLPPESVFSCLSVDKPQDTDPRVGGKAWLHDATDVASTDFIYMYSKAEWLKFRYVLDTSRKGLFLYSSTDDNFFPEKILFLSACKIGTCHKSIISSLSFDAFYICFPENCITKYVYLTLMDNEFTANLLHLLIIVKQDKMFQSVQLGDADGLQMHSKVDNMSHTSTKTRVTLSHMELPSSLQNMDFATEVTLLLDGIPVAKPRNVFANNTRITWNEDYEFDTELSQAVAVVLNKVTASNTLSLKCEVPLNAIKFNETTKYSYYHGNYEGVVVMYISMVHNVLLPRSIYLPFLSNILNQELGNIFLLNNILESDEWCSHIVNIMAQYNIEENFFQKVACHEIAAFNEPKAFISSKSLTTKLLVAFLRKYGHKFFKGCVSEFYMICRTLGSFEIDDSRTTKTDKLNNNLIYLFKLLNILLIKIFKAVPLFPKMLSKLINWFLCELNTKWHNSAIIQRKIFGYLIFERFLCFKIKKSDEYKCFDEDEKHKRCFEIVVHVLNKLSSYSFNDIGDPLFATNAFIKLNTGKMEALRSKLLGNYAHQERPVVRNFDENPYYLSKDIDFIFKKCISYYSTIKIRSAENDEYRALLNSVDSIMDLVQRYQANKH